MKEQKPFQERKINMERLADLKPLEGDVYSNVKVVDIGSQGDGIVRVAPSGQIAIIKDKTLKKGQIVNIEITKVTTKCLFAKLTEK